MINQTILWILDVIRPQDIELIELILVTVNVILKIGPHPHIQEVIVERPQPQGN